ncbi:MAG: phosphoadenylyl-sulfate reductase [Bacteroidales bacterium]
MKIEDIRNNLENKGITERIAYMAKVFPGKVIFTTSFGLEDQVITDYIFANDLPVKVVTLDTGRMFEETYKVFSRTRDRYGKNIDVYFPRKDAVQKLMTDKGPYSFYESIENRKECCGIRKVEPLHRALQGMECWITGIRRDQNENRHDMHELEWDDGYGLYKMNPLVDWTLKDVESFIRKNNIPYNTLFDKGFVSIGCAPCTRAIKPGEDFRAGRWWWEQSSGKECGLHTHGK